MATAAETEIRGLIHTLQSQIERVAGIVDTNDNTTNNLINQLRAHIGQIGSQSNQGGSQGSRKEMRLLSDKDVKPQFFNGGPTEEFKNWAKKTKTFLNMKCDTFRATLTWAEAETTKIDDQSMQAQNWRDQEEGNPKLHDYLCSVLDKEPLLIAEKTPGNGLEAWRRLNKRFDPHGGQHDMDRYESLVYGTRKAKNLEELPKMIEAWEKEIDNFTSRTSEFPIHDSLKTCVLLKMAPDDYARELKFKYNAVKQDYDTLRDNIMEFCSINAPPTSYKGPLKMDLSPLAHGAPAPEEEKWSNAEWAEWVYDEQNPTSDLDYLGKPRKGKGKGKGAKGKGTGKGGKTREAWDAAKVKLYEEKRCFICGEEGHQASRCPKNPAAKALKSIEEEEEAAMGLGADLKSLTRDVECGGFERDCGTFEEDEEATDPEFHVSDIDPNDLDVHIGMFDIDLSYEHEGRRFDGKRMADFHNKVSERIASYDDDDQVQDDDAKTTGAFTSPPVRTSTASTKATSPLVDMFRREMEEARNAAKIGLSVDQNYTPPPTPSTPKSFYKTKISESPAEPALLYPASISCSGGIEFEDILGSMFPDEPEGEVHNGEQKMETSVKSRRRHEAQDSRSDTDSSNKQQFRTS